MNSHRRKSRDGIVSYDEDIVAWSQQQALFLLRKDWQDLDLEHLADEILDVGKSEQRELKSRMSILLLHLLKWAYQPSMRCGSWQLSVRNQREELETAIKVTPSLKVSLRDPLWYKSAWRDSLPKVVKETGLSLAALPQNPIWDAQQVLQRDWLPPKLAEN